MTKEELEREYYGRRPTEPYSEDDSPNDWANIVQYAEENLDKAFKAIAELEKEKCELLGIIQGKDKVIQELKKENAELEEKISVLLSCKNCPENKGGWVCVKEYENKCLSQKIMYIKELKKENAELKDKLKILIAVGNTCTKGLNKQLTKAKELLAKWVELFSPKGGNIPPTPIQVETEQFISGVEK